MQVRHRVDRIIINFPETADRLNLTGRERDRIIRVGNPILPGFGAVSRADARKQLGLAPDEVSVLAFGGSLGAERLNDALVALAERVARDLPHVTLTFAAGKRDYDRTAANLKGSAAAGCPRISLLDYIYDMPVRMAAADLVVSRAGAMTVCPSCPCSERRRCWCRPRMWRTIISSATRRRWYGRARVCASRRTDCRAVRWNAPSCRCWRNRRSVPPWDSVCREGFACPDANREALRGAVAPCTRAGMIPPEPEGRRW